MCVADLGAKTAWGALRVSTIPGTDIPLYLIEHEAYFGREQLYGTGAYEYDDNAERFCFFCLALLHGVARTDWRPDVVHCHDWHTAAIPAYIKTRLAHTEAWRGMPTVLTIHNLAYQGRYKARFLPYTGLGWDLFTPDCLEFDGDINLMKGGIAFASVINAVSPRYAKEIQTPEYGEGLDGFLSTRSNRLYGILNGVDYAQWNPRTDPHIAAPYGPDDFRGKERCKVALQRRVGLPERAAPLIGMVTRLYWQKGVDLVAQAMDSVMRLDVQLVILGTGNALYERMLAGAVAGYPEKARLLTQFDVALSHQIQAGSDFFLFPSRYEPCGLSQMYGLAYGTVPIVRETGGLADTVRPLTPANLRKGRATGIVFRPISPEAIVASITQAARLYESPEILRSVRVAGMKEDFSWERSSKAYVRLYHRAMAKP
jgi:starch synthase